MLWEQKDLVVLVVDSLIAKTQEKSGDVVLQETECTSCLEYCFFLETKTGEVC